MIAKRDLFLMDTKDPAFVAHFEALLPGLKTRKLSDLYALHYHVKPGVVKCLDLNIVTPDLDLMDVAVKAKVSELFAADPDQVVEASPDDEWMAFVQAPKKYTRRIRLAEFRSNVVGVGEES